MMNGRGRWMLAALLALPSCATAPPAAPVCTLASESARAELAAVARECRVRIARDDRGLQVAFPRKHMSRIPGGIYRFVDRLSLREKSCCPFLSLWIEREPEEYVLFMTADEKHRSTLDEYAKILTP